MTNRYVPNPAFQAELAASTMFEDDMRAVAENLAQETEALAPEESGAFKEGIEAVSGEGYARVNLNDWKSVFIEFGTRDHPFGAPLRRAIERMGLRLERSR